MKGISELITAILMMLVVVSLAGMAYFWISGMSGTLSDSSKSAANDAGSAINTEFILESARGIDLTTVSVMVRNTGKPDINASKIGAYLDGAMLTNTAPSYLVIQGGDVALINLTNANNPIGKRLMLVSDNGFEVLTTVT